MIDTFILTHQKRGVGVRFSSAAFAASLFPGLNIRVDEIQGTTAAVQERYQPPLSVAVAVDMSPRRR